MPPTQRPDPFLVRLRGMLNLARLQQALVASLVQNPGFKVLSVVFAMALWAWVQGEQSAEIKTRVKVEWSLPKGLAVSNEVPDSVVVTVSGSQMFLRNVRRANLVMKVDISDAVPGKQTIEFQDRPIQGLPQNVRMMSVTPTNAEFLLEKQIVRKVKVLPVTVGEPANGYRFISALMDPKVVEMTGPLNVMAGITELSTGPVDLTGTREDREEEVVLARVPAFVSLVDEKPLVMKIDVEAINKERTIENVPVVVRSKGWMVTPEHVTVALEGPVDELEALHVDDVTVVVQVPDNLTRSSHKVTAKGSRVTYTVVHRYTEHVTVTAVDPPTFTIVPLE